MLSSLSSTIMTVLAICPTFQHPHPMPNNPSEDRWPHARADARARAENLVPICYGNANIMARFGCGRTAGRRRNATNSVAHDRTLDGRRRASRGCRCLAAAVPSGARRYRHNARPGAIVLAREIGGLEERVKWRPDLGRFDWQTGRAGKTVSLI